MSEAAFHRYAYDERWRVPSFEKMLYDQAFLAELYAELFNSHRIPLFKQVALETIHYMSDTLANPGGGFFTSEDAASLPEPDATQPIPGAFYSWSHADFKSALAPDPVAHSLLQRCFDNPPPRQYSSRVGSRQHAQGQKRPLPSTLPATGPAREADISADTAGAVYESGLALPPAEPAHNARDQ